MVTAVRRAYSLPSTVKCAAAASHRRQYAYVPLGQCATNAIVHEVLVALRGVWDGGVDELVLDLVSQRFGAGQLAVQLQAVHQLRQVVLRPAYA